MNATRFDAMVAYYTMVFHRVQNPDNWKAPWAASVPLELVEAVINAVNFFHADIPEVIGVEPITGKILMKGKGYQA